MSAKVTRRTLIQVAAVAAGAAAVGAAGCAEQARRQAGPCTTTGPWAAAGPPRRAKVRIAKVYAGRPNGSWPAAAVDIPAERQRFEAAIASLAPQLADIEFIDVGVVSDSTQVAAACEKCKAADGILVLQLSMGIGGLLAALLELDRPTVLFAETYCGHEWHTVAGLQRAGKRLDCYPTSRLEDIAEAVRPLRAIGRLRTAKALHVSTREAAPAYVKAIREKFGTEIKSLLLPDLEAAYKGVPDAAALAEAHDWTAGAEKIVEPTADDILKAARMSLALKTLVEAEHADAITINCLGMGLISRDMGYPCLGFVRLNNCGRGGICEADLKSTMTHMLFSFLVGRPGFVTDPCFDYATNTILHAHCVGATRMEGPDGPAAPYIIRSHLEDNRGAVLQVKMRFGGPVTMARLIGDEALLFSTGQSVGSPLVDRGCRTKLAVRVERPEKFLEGWSCGLHRVVFYGDHTRDVERFCRLMKIRLLHEGADDLRDAAGLEWGTNVHASAGGCCCHGPHLA